MEENKDFVAEATDVQTEEEAALNTTEVQTPVVTNFEEESKNEMMFKNIGGNK